MASSESNVDEMCEKRATSKTPKFPARSCHRRVSTNATFSRVRALRWGVKKVEWRREEAAWLAQGRAGVICFVG
jgi:hypothetical protein